MSSFYLRQYSPLLSHKAPCLHPQHHLGFCLCQFFPNSYFFGSETLSASHFGLFVFRLTLLIDEDSDFLGLARAWGPNEMGVGWGEDWYSCPEATLRGAGFRA